MTPHELFEHAVQITTIVAFILGSLAFIIDVILHYLSPDTLVQYPIIDNIGGWGMLIAMIICCFLAMGACLTTTTTGGKLE